MITDTHFGVKSDHPDFIQNQKEFYDELFFPKLIENDIKEFIHLGDIFDRRKYTNHQTLHTFKECFFDKLKEHNIKMHLILGNHDVYYKSTNNINSPELFLEQYSDFINIINKPCDIKIDNQYIAFIPWINGNNYTECLEFIKSSKSKVLCGHFEIQGFEMHRGGGKNLTGMKTEIFSNFDKVYSGHFHEPSESNNIQYIGAPSEYTWADYECKRGFYLYDIKPSKLKFIRNNNKMFYRIVYDDNFNENEFDISNLSGKIVRLINTDDTNIKKFEAFIEKIENVNPSNFEVIDNVGYHIDNEAIDNEAIKSEDTLALVKSYVEESEMSLDKDKLNTMFRSLYMEAIAEE